jgi:hypothetical protein
MSEPIECDLYIDGKKINPIKVVQYTDDGKYRRGVIEGYSIGPPVEPIPAKSQQGQLVFKGQEKPVPVTLTEMTYGGRRFVSDIVDWPPMDEIAPKPPRYP